MQRCLRQLWFAAALFDFEVRALHVPGKHNQFADYLSRWHSDPLARDNFHRLCRDSDQAFCFQDVDTTCFSFDVSWHYCHIFVLSCFLCRLPSQIWPTSTARCFSCPLEEFLMAYCCFGPRSVHTEEHSGSYPQLSNVLRTESSPALSY